MGAWSESARKYYYSEKGIKSRKKYWSSIKGKDTARRYRERRKERLNAIKKKQNEETKSIEVAKTKPVKNKKKANN